MKLIIVALALAAVVAAAPPQEPLKIVPIVRSDIDQRPDGSYERSYETANGISQNEIGELKQVTGEDNKPNTVLVMRGSYQYIDNVGQLHTVNYYADETGFHAESADIPTAAPARR